MTVTVKNRQTLSDIAIQVYGTIEAVVAIAEANGVGVTDDLPAGLELECPDEVYGRYLQSYVRKRKIESATAADPDGEVRMKIFTEQFTKEFE